MTISYHWHDPRKTIICLHFEPGWQWQDLHALLAHIAPDLSMLHYPVAMIMDLQASPLLPPREFSTNVKKLISYYHKYAIDAVVFAINEPSIAHLLYISHNHFGLINCKVSTAPSVNDALNQIYNLRNQTLLTLDMH